MTASDLAVCVALRPDVNAPRQARRIVQQACTQAGQPDGVADNAVFVAGELVTHSIRQARGPMRMQVVVDHGEVTLRVGDGGAMSPAHARAGALRSWEVVKRLSASFGYQCHDGGREMWAVLRVDQRAVCSA